MAYKCRNICRTYHITTFHSVTNQESAILHNRKADKSVHLMEFQILIIDYMNLIR